MNERNGDQSQSHLQNSDLNNKVQNWTEIKTLLSAVFILMISFGILSIPGLLYVSILTTEIMRIIFVSISMLLLIIGVVFLGINGFFRATHRVNEEKFNKNEVVAVLIIIFAFLPAILFFLYRCNLILYSIVLMGTILVLTYLNRIYK